MSYIIKRDGHKESFDSSKIYNAVYKAFQNSSEKCVNIQDIVDIVMSKLNNINYMVEDVQDIVEKTLMELHFYDTAKRYILYRKEHDEHRKKYGIILKKTKPIDVPWGPVGYITYKRTYSRQLNDNNLTNPSTEEFEDTIMRVLSACQNQLKIGFTCQEIDQAREYFMKLKCSVAGRFLWSLGSKTVDTIGLASLQNCAFTTVDDPIKSFSWAFNMMMLGSGVGFNIQHKHVDKIQEIKNVNITITRQDTKDADFIVPDSREGWIKLLEEVMKAYFITGDSFSYSTILIRGKGTPIKTFGGVASGPEDLCIGIENICNVLNKRKGQKLRPIDCLDIMNIIGSVVIAGGIRRAAQIALGDPTDLEFLKAKRWDLGNIPNWRSYSNNSVICSSIDELPDAFWDGYMGKGEPYGLVNIELAKKVGRIIDGDKYPDPLVEGVNPCGEIVIPNRSTCCLAEIFLNNVDNYIELKNVATILYKICKHSLLLKCHLKDTEKIVHEQMRMGISISGYMMVSDEKRGWLSDLYVYLREFDNMYSDSHNIPRSIKLTTIKPSGTLSLLAGSTPGMHPAIYKFFIRRIQFSANNSLIEICKKHGFKTEHRLNFDGTYDYNCIVVEFPCRFPDEAILAKDLSVIQELEIVKHLQNVWSDNAVSVTCYYKQEELDDIKLWLKNNYTDNIKSVSFLLHHDSNFKQMPYEEISEEKYNELIINTNPISSMTNIQDEYEDIGAECRSGMCPVR
jgi:hypothetical protein